jgi:hypothetical protein
VTYQESAAALAQASEAAVASAYETLRAAGFIIAAAQIVAVFNVRAVALADLAVASLLATLPLGLSRPDDDDERLVVSFTTLLDRIAEDPPEVARAKVSRIAMGEPLDSGRLGLRQAMAAHPRLVVGWTRRARPDACELCRALADGTVLPPEHRMYDHPGCNCVPVPVPIEGGQAA